MFSSSRFRLVLTLDEAASAEQLVASYADFWSHVRFRMGTESPPFSRVDVEPDLYNAAYDVIRIQSYLDTRDPSFKMRLIGGNVRAYLHSLKDLPADRHIFVRKICLASFQDAAGHYMESSEEEILEFLAEISLLKKQIWRCSPSKMQ